MFKDIKTIAQHSVIYGLGIYISKAIGFFMIPVYTRFLTPSDYGVIELLNLTSWMLGILLCMGISSAVFRFYFQYETGERDGVISSALIFIAAISTFTVTLLFLASRNISILIFKDAHYAPYLQFIFISAMFDMIDIVPSTYIRIRKKSALFVILSLIRLAFALSINIYLIVFLQMGVKGVLWSNVISSILMASITLIYTLRNVRLTFSFNKMKELLKYGFPLMPEALFVFVIHFFNRYFLQHFLTLDEVGIFSLGYRFSMILPFLIGQPFGLIWSTYRFEIAGRWDAKKVYARILTYYFLITLGFCLMVSVFIKDIVHMITTPAFYAAYGVVPLITLGFVFWGLGLVFDTGILIQKKTYLKTIISAIAMTVSLGLNYLLIPRIGIWGAAIASFCSFTIMSLMSFAISEKLYPIPCEWLRLAKIALAAGIAYTLSIVIQVDNAFIAMALKSSIIALFVFLLFISKFFDGGEVGKLRILKDKAMFLLKGIKFIRPAISGD